MKIRMLHDRTGGRYDGQPWPARGGTFEVPDDEGEFLIERGIAEPAEPAEYASAAAAVSAAKPIVNSPKADWVAHAVSQGAAPDEAAAMTKADLIAAYGGSG